MFSELSSNISNKQHFYSKQNVQQNLRHRNVDFQCKTIEFTSKKIFVIVLILYQILTFLAFRAYLLELPPQDYINKGKTIKNLNIKKCDKNYCTHSRIRNARICTSKTFLPVQNNCFHLQFNLHSSFLVHKKVPWHALHPPK